MLSTYQMSPSGIEDNGDSIKIGAMTTHADVASSATVKKGISAVADLAGQHW